MSLCMPRQKVRVSRQITIFGWIDQYIAVWVTQCENSALHPSWWTQINRLFTRKLVFQYLKIMFKVQQYVIHSNYSKEVDYMYSKCTCMPLYHLPPNNNQLSVVSFLCVFYSECITQNVYMYMYRLLWGFRLCLVTGHSD